MIFGHLDERQTSCHQRSVVCYWCVVDDDEVTCQQDWTDQLCLDGF